MDANKWTHRPQRNGCQDKNNVVNDPERGGPGGGGGAPGQVMNCGECVWCHVEESGKDAVRAVASGVASVSCAHLDQGGGDIWVGDPAGEDQRLLLLHVQHVCVHSFLLHKRLLAV